MWWQYHATCVCLSVTVYSRFKKLKNFKVDITYIYVIQRTQNFAARFLRETSKELNYKKLHNLTPSSTKSSTMWSAGHKAYMREKRNTCKFLIAESEGKRPLADLGEWWTNLTRMLTSQRGKAWSGLVWHRTETCWRLMWTLQWIFILHQTYRTLLPEALLDSQGLCSACLKNFMSVWLGTPMAEIWYQVPG
jgi:hypothetical protein